MCDAAVMEDPCALKFAPDHFKSQEMCDKAVGVEPFPLQYVPDWFVTQQQVKLWHDDYFYDDDEIIEWCDDYKKQKVQKAQIEEKFHPLLGIHHDDKIGVFQRQKNR